MLIFDCIYTFKYKINIYEYVHTFFLPPVCSATPAPPLITYSVQYSVPTYCQYKILNIQHFIVHIVVQNLFSIFNAYINSGHDKQL